MKINEFGSKKKNYTRPFSRFINGSNIENWAYNAAEFQVQIYRGGKATIMIKFVELQCKNVKTYTCFIRSLPWRYFVSCFLLDFFLQDLEFFRFR